MWCIQRVAVGSGVVVGTRVIVALGKGVAATVGMTGEELPGLQPDMKNNIKKTKNDRRMAARLLVGR
jgi:hypothetical protein